jgi:hypothetical protein
MAVRRVLNDYADHTMQTIALCQGTSLDVPTAEYNELGLQPLGDPLQGLKP